MSINMLKDIGIKTKIIIYNKMTYAVDIHRKAMMVVLICNHTAIKYNI